MLRNYFTIAWRHLTKARAYTIINITGLATGMAIALLIGLWINDEFDFDHYSPNHSRLAKGLITSSFHGEYYTGDVVSMAMGPALRNQYGDLFKRTALQCDGGSHLFSHGDKVVSAPAIYAQQELPVMFGFRITQGSLDAAKDPTTALIDQSLATALFGKDDPIGQTIKADNQVPFRVGGVYEDLPNNTTFHGIQVVMPWYNPANNYHNSNTDWDDHNGYIYVELQPNVTAEQATERIHLLPTPYFKSWREEAAIYPLDKYHLYSDFEKGKPAGTGAIRFVWLFGIIGGFVLLLACINFMNLSTARSEKRAKEVGIRKTIGSVTSQLITQFLSESILVSLISLCIALILVQLALPAFNTLAAKDLHIPYSSPFFWLITLAFALFTGLLAGSYPAFYLSRFKPVKVLKGSFKSGRYASLPRQVLVVLQFTVSLALIIGTIIVFRQIMYTKDRPVGYTRQGLFTVRINTPELGKHYEALRTELIADGLADNVAASDMTPTSFDNGNALHWRGKTPAQEAIMFRNVNVSDDYGRTIRWTILQGRDFSREYPTDSNAMILNDTAARIIGIKDPVGETVSLFGRKYHIIGVAANMVSNSPYEKVEPAMFCGGRYTSQIIVRIKPGLATSTALAKMAPIFRKYNPASPFIYNFVDKAYEAKFEAEQRIGNLASVFTALAILISCLGLFGLAAFVAEQRTKEIGVRRVLGAGIFSVWGLLSKDFLKLTALSILIAMPLAYLGMYQWLESYPYHAPLSWWIFASAGAGILLLTLATVSFQSLKAAMLNPVRSLRSE
ncbi:MAG TPA: ABC transporter permease [Puia sp.]|nr:ABC transporter permease [Puia sp.]